MYVFHKNQIMTQDNRDLLKNIATVLAVGAAIAGVAYLLKDNEKVQDVWAKAKDKATDGLDKVKEGWGDLAETARSKFSHNA